MTKLARKPRRMNPSARETALLQCAAKIVAEEGVSAVTMERIAQESGVSRSLVYLYFQNSTVLLQQLYLRETMALRKRQTDEAAKIVGFDEYIRCLITLFLENVAEKGDFMSKLMHEPSITDVLQADFSEARKVTGLAIAKRISKKHVIPVHIAAIVADIGMGLTARAGEQIQRFGLPLLDVIDITVAMVLGAIEKAANGYHRGEVASGLDTEISR